MASRYIQKYPIPQDFPTILKNFTREVLRDQPDNIIEYSAKYFQALEQGRPFSYQSPFNVPQGDRQYHLDFDTRKATELLRKDVQINQGGLSRAETKRVNEVVDMLFSKYDRDRNGYLDSKELKSMIVGIQTDGKIGGVAVPTDIEIMSFASQIDANHNGKIDKQELFNFIKGTLF